MNVVMEDHGSQCSSHRRGSGLRASTKSKAPSPPPQTGSGYPDLSQHHPSYHSYPGEVAMEEGEAELNLVVVLPGGVEKTTSVQGSKPLMDLLVMLCAQHHLSPSSHTLELVTSNRKHIKFKPNARIGALDAQRVLLRLKGDEDTNRTACPQMPEATIRMVINYKKSQKTILRVNPRVPLAELLPAICDKCEFEPETTVLLRDVQADGPLDLSKSLNDYAIRDVYARGSEDDLDSPVCPASPAQSATKTLGKDKKQKEKENKVFSMFRRSKQRPEQPATASAPASPVLVSKPRPLSMALPSMHSSPLDDPLSGPPEAPKKRRAPQPPGTAPQSCPAERRTARRLNSEPGSPDHRNGWRRRSSDSTLKSTKRKAPPPPSSPPVVPDQPSLQDDPMPLDQTSSQDQSSPRNSSQAGPALEQISEQEESSPPLLCEERERCMKALSPGGLGGGGASGDQPGDLSTDGKSTQRSLEDTVPTLDTPVKDTVPTLDTPVKDTVPALDTPVKDTVPALEDTPVKDTVPTLEDTPVKDTVPTLGTPVKDTVPALEDTPVGEAERERESTPTPPLPHEGGGPPDVGEAQHALSAPGGRDPHTTASPGEEDGDLPAPPPPDLPAPPPPDLPAPPPLDLPAPPPPDLPAPPPLDLPAPPPPDLPAPPPLDLPAPPPPDLPAPPPPGDLPAPPPPGDLPAPPPPDLPAPPPPGDLPVPPQADGPRGPGAADSDPKPKPSNEVTRDYIPKVGLTTTTIVPHRALDRLRYFEVELTLEPPPSPPLSPPAQQGQERPLKVPPRTRPKPASFRQPPPSEVSTAAVRRLSSLPGARPASPPPPPPPAEGGVMGGGVTGAGWAGRGPPSGLSLDKLRSFTAPRPYTPSTPSRFARAVSSAVRRSQALAQASPASPASSAMKGGSWWDQTGAVVPPQAGDEAQRDQDSAPTPQEPPPE